MRLSFYTGLAVAVLAADTAEAKERHADYDDFGLAQIDEVDENASMAQTDNQNKAGAESGSEGDAVATAETESNAASDSEVWTDVESGAESDAESEVHTESEAESGAESEVESESEAPTEAENSS